MNSCGYWNASWLGIQIRLQPWLRACFGSYETDSGFVSMTQDSGKLSTVSVSIPDPEKYHEFGSDSEQNVLAPAPRRLTLPRLTGRNRRRRRLLLGQVSPNRWRPAGSGICLPPPPEAAELWCIRSLWAAQARDAMLVT